MVTITRDAPRPAQQHRNGSLWISVASLVVATALSLGTAYRWLDIRFRVGPYFVTHWLSLIGTLFIAVYTPLYYVVKRRRPRFIKSLIAVHMFGNLISFALISMHFAQQLTRLAS
jgi:ABC-type glycerol-3-phosphate transport system permease component